MSGNPIKQDLSNFEEWVQSHLQNGKVLTAEGLKDPFFSLLSYVKELHRRIEDLERRHHSE